MSTQQLRSAGQRMPSLIFSSSLGAPTHRPKLLARPPGLSPRRCPVSLTTIDFLPPRIFTHSSRSGPGGHTEPQESRRRHQHAKTELEALIHSIAARDGRGFNAQVHSAALAFLRGLGADMCLGPQSSSGVAKLVEQPSDSTSHYSFSASPLHVCANARTPCGAFRVTCV